MKKGVLDRFEEGFGVIVFENGEVLSVPSDRLPEGASGGMSLIVPDEGPILADEEDTVLRKTRINSLMDRLFG